jgi:tetratricopeptide (TPR) repeat protein
MTKSVLAKLARKFLPAQRDSPMVADRPADAVAAATIDGAAIADAALRTAAARAAEGRFEVALSAIDRALDARPDSPALHVARGAALYEWGRFRDSRESLLRAHALGADDPGLPLKLGWSCMAAGFRDDAVAWMGHAVAVQPESSKALFGYGVALQSAGRSDDALVCFEKLLAAEPADYECLIQLGICMVDRKDFATAETLFRRAIAARPDLSVGWTNLCVVLDHADRTEELLEALETIDRLDAAAGRESDNFVDKALAWGDQGRLEDAIALCERNLPTRPSARGHFIYAMLLLRAGRMHEGWIHYDFRWMVEQQSAHRARFGKPVWTGQDLRGKTILLRREQGFGDLIQFVRYAPMFKALGATVWLQVRPGIAALAPCFAGVDRVFDDNAPLPDFDFYAQLMSLPRVFGADLDRIPASVPYLQLGPELVDDWARRLAQDPRFRVGIAWAGDPHYRRDRHRSIALRELAPLLAVENVRFISLQRGPAAAEHAQAPELPLEDLCAGVRNFGDAGLIAAMDLVISVDSAVAHLAGALGKRVWLLQTTPADFRWFDEREDSPWYPTLRLFRQTRRGRWDDVVARAATELRALARRGRSGAKAPAHSRASPKMSPLPWAPPPDRPPFSAVIETRAGILQYLPQDAKVGKSLRWYGEHLQRQIDLIARVVKPGSTAIEAGAGVGAHTVPLARHLGAPGHLLAYEARALERRILGQNLAVNEIGNVTVMRRALGKPTDAGAWQPAETIDDLNLRQLALVKTNGAVDADSVLAGAQQSLWRLRPLLFLGVASETEAQAVAQRARDAGYACWQMETPFFDPRNFNRREEDVFRGRVALAVVGIPEEIEIGVALDGCRKLA